VPTPGPTGPARTTPHHAAMSTVTEPEEDTTTQPTPLQKTRPQPWRRLLLRRLAVAVALSIALLVVVTSPAFAQGGGAAPTLSGVIDNLRNWIVGILAGVATLFLTIGGLRYLTAGGDPGQVEKAKTALKSAAIGYALAILAPLLVSILASIVGG
jgi:hypothetical protein